MVRSIPTPPKLNLRLDRLPTEIRHTIFQYLIDECFENLLNRACDTLDRATYRTNASHVAIFSKQDLAFSALGALGGASPTLRKDLIDLLSLQVTRLRELIRSREKSSSCVGGAEHQDLVQITILYMSRGRVIKKSGGDGLRCRYISCGPCGGLISLLKFLLGASGLYVFYMRNPKREPPPTSGKD